MPTLITPLRFAQEIISLLYTLNPTPFITVEYYPSMDIIFNHSFLRALFLLLSNMLLTFPSSYKNVKPFLSFTSYRYVTILFPLATKHYTMIVSVCPSKYSFL